MDVIIDSYIVNKKLKNDRLAFKIMEITIFTLLYTRFKVYLFIPYVHFVNYPQKVADYKLEVI